MERPIAYYILNCIHLTRPKLQKVSHSLYISKEIKTDQKRFRLPEATTVDRKGPTINE